MCQPIMLIIYTNIPITETLNIIQEQLYVHLTVIMKHPKIIFVFESCQKQNYSRVPIIRPSVIRHSILSDTFRGRQHFYFVVYYCVLSTLYVHTQ